MLLRISLFLFACMSGNALAQNENSGESGSELHLEELEQYNSIDVLYRLPHSLSENSEGVTSKLALPSDLYRYFSDEGRQETRSLNELLDGAAPSITGSAYSGYHLNLSVGDRVLSVPTELRSGSFYFTDDFIKPFEAAIEKGQTTPIRSGNRSAPSILLDAIERAHSECKGCYFDQVDDPLTPIDLDADNPIIISSPTDVKPSCPKASDTQIKICELTGGSMSCGKCTTE